MIVTEAACGSSRDPATATGGGDYDSQYRPQQRFFGPLRTRTPWDLGGDELPGTQVPLTPPLQ